MQTSSGSEVLLFHPGASMHFPHKGRKTIAFHFAEMSCQRLHLRLLMKLGVLAELLGSSFLPRLKSKVKTGIYRALLTLVSKCLSG